MDRSPTVPTYAPASISQRVRLELFVTLDADLDEEDDRGDIEDRVEQVLRVWNEKMRGQSLGRIYRAALRFEAARMPAEGLEDLEIEEV